MLIGGSALAAAALALFLQGRLGGTAEAALAAYALLLAPGILLVRATGLRERAEPAELPALWLIASLAALTPAFLVPFLFHGSITTIAPAYVLTIAVLAVIASLGKGFEGGRGLVRRAAESTPGHPQSPAETEDRAGPFVTTLVGVLAVVTTAAAFDLTRTGSIDRWWYLAYVRQYMDAAALDFGEPFFGGGHVVDRFRFNAWLVALASWARLSGADPVWIYERACPVLLVPATFSAALFFGRALLGRGRPAWLVALGTALLWVSGSLFPILTRIPEDKILAMLVVAPVVVGASILIAREERAGAWAALASALVVLATVHGLIYAIVLLTLVPALAWMTIARIAKPATVAALVALLAAGALYPAWAGLGARGALEADGATLENLDHPVVRIHHARARLIDLEGGGYLVKPQLLSHPLTILALLCAPLILRRSPFERAVLAPAVAIPLAVAFIPPLAGAAGHIVLPWMVYRLLWAVPYGVLLALGMLEASTLLGRHRWFAVLALVSLSTPWTVHLVSGGPREERSELATPESGPIRDAMAEISRLGATARVAAAPELSERIPALTGARVLAASDRASVVFSGSRSLGEERLRARASLMAGLWTPRENVTPPTHLLVAPGTAASSYCGERLFRTEELELCEFAERPRVRSHELLRAERGSRASHRIGLYDMLFEAEAALTAGCTPGLEESEVAIHAPKPGPWAVASPHLLCAIRPSESSTLEAFRPRSLTLVPVLGHAVEELTVVATARRSGRPAWRADAQVRLRNKEPLVLAFPDQPVETLYINVVPNFLPFVKLVRYTIGFDAATSEPGG